MILSSDVNSSAGKPRPPVPPRPNKSVLDEAILKYKCKTNIEPPEGMVSVTKNKSLCFNNSPIFNNTLKNVRQVRTDLGQHVHEDEPIFRQNGQRNPTVLSINEAKTLGVLALGPSGEFSESPKMHFQVDTQTQELSTKIKQSNWYQVEEDSGRPVKYSSCQIILDDSCSSSPVTQRPRAVSMSSLQGLPPLPKSLSGINLLENVKVTSQTPVTSESPRTTKTHQTRVPFTAAPPPTSESKKPVLIHPRKVTTLETQLAMLRKEMYSLRELDLSLLSQLWSLNESIQEFRQMQETFSPPSPSSDAEDDAIYSNLSVLAEHQSYPLSSSSSRSSNMDMGDV